MAAPSSRLGHPDRASVSLESMLPGMLAADEFTSAFVGALDQVLAPVHRTLDSFWAYLDPRLGPLDFGLWLATWLNAEPDESWPEAQIRANVLQAWSGFVERGTPTGLAAELERLVPGEWSIEDSGGVGRSRIPGGALPGSSDPSVRVRVTPADPAAVDQERLRRLVAARLPAHVRLDFEVVA